MKSLVSCFGVALTLLLAIDVQAAATANPQEGYAWHLRTVELVAGHDNEVKTDGGVWRDLHTDSVTGRVWNAQLVDAGGRTNGIVFTSSCSLPPKIVKPDTEIRFCLTATCESVCTGRSDRVFVKWNSGNDNDPRPDEAFRLVDGERIPGGGTNGIVLCAAAGRPRAVSGVYGKVLPPGDRRGRKRDLVFFGSGALTKWTYEWARIDEGNSGAKKNAGQIQRVLAGSPELKKALEELASKGPDFWEACDTVLPEEEPVVESDDTDTEESPSVFLRLLKWLLWLSVLALAGFAAWKKRLLTPENLQKLWQRVKDVLIYLWNQFRRIPWKWLGERLLHYARRAGHYFGIAARYVLENARRGYAWLRRKYDERRKSGKKSQE